MLARSCLLGALIVCAGCDDSMSPSNPAPNLTGTWTGQIGSPMSATAVRFTWTATQSGSNASGAARLVKPAIGTELPGTMTATVSGNQVSLNFAAAAGSVPTLPACTASGSGTGTINGSSISGTFTLTAAACDSIGIEPATSAALSMMR